MNLVPPHRTYINYFINKGIIDSYSVSMESYRSWIMLIFESRDEVRKYLKKSPLFKYWTYGIDECFIYDGQNHRLPALQMNQFFAHSCLGIFTDTLFSEDPA